MHEPFQMIICEGVGYFLIARVGPCRFLDAHYFQLFSDSASREAGTEFSGVQLPTFGT